jgi:hypothetical protein
MQETVTHAKIVAEAFSANPASYPSPQQLPAAPLGALPFECLPVPGQAVAHLDLRALDEDVPGWELRPRDHVQRPPVLRRGVRLFEEKRDKV